MECCVVVCAKIVNRYYAPLKKANHMYLPLLSSIVNSWFFLGWLLGSRQKKRSQCFWLQHLEDLYSSITTYFLGNFLLFFVTKNSILTLIWLCLDAIYYKCFTILEKFSRGIYIYMAAAGTAILRSLNYFSNGEPIQRKIKFIFGFEVLYL